MKNSKSDLVLIVVLFSIAVFLFCVPITGDNEAVDFYWNNHYKPNDFSPDSFTGFIMNHLRFVKGAIDLPINFIRETGHYLVAPFTKVFPGFVCVWLDQNIQLCINLVFWNNRSSKDVG